MTLKEAIAAIKKEESNFRGYAATEKLAGNIVIEANNRGTATGLLIALQILEECSVTQSEPSECNDLLGGLKEWDDVDVIFLDAHAIGGRAWVSFGEYREWSGSEVYVHVSGKFIELTEKYLKIVMGFGAHFGEGQTDNVINPFAIPLSAIIEVHKLKRVKA